MRDLWAAVTTKNTCKQYKQSRINRNGSNVHVTWYRLYGNETVTMQLDKLSQVEWDTQPVNGLDSLETV